MKKNDKCPICDLGLLEKIIKDDTFVIEGKEIILHNVIAYHCKDGCGEIFVDNKEFKRTGKLLEKIRNKDK